MLQGHSFPVNPIAVAPWPQYKLSTKSVLQLMRNNITVIPDGTHFSDCEFNIVLLSLGVTDFLLEKTNFLDSSRVLAEFQK